MTDTGSSWLWPCCAFLPTLYIYEFGLTFDYRLPLFEDPDQLLLKDHHEAWYDINVWSVIVDRCLQDIKGMVILRYVLKSYPTFSALTPKFLHSGEPTSMASTLRKNRDRVDKAKRQRIGSRFDGLGQDDSGQFEYVAMEAARTFESETCSKWLHDYQKVGKSLHDMLYRLQWLVNQDETVLEKLQLVGLVSAGMSCPWTSPVIHAKTLDQDCTAKLFA